MSFYRFLDGRGDTGMVVGGISSLSFEQEARARGRTDEVLVPVDDYKELLESDELRHAVVDGLTHAIDRRISTEIEGEIAAREEQERHGSHIGEAAMRDGTGTIGFAAPDASPSGTTPEAGVDPAEVLPQAPHSLPE